MSVESSSTKNEINMLKMQLDNLVETYNNDTNDLNNKLTNALWEKHNLKLDLIKVKNELIETKKAFRIFKDKVSTPVPIPVVNNTDNNKHTEIKKRWRPKKVNN